VATAASPGVFQMAPRQPEGPQKAQPRPAMQGKPRPKVRELQPGAWIGAFLFGVLLVTGLAAVAQQFVLPIMQSVRR
jgi:hypothetical protein